jgi:hypothetical protein
MELTKIRRALPILVVFSRPSLISSHPSDGPMPRIGQASLGRMQSLPASGSAGSLPRPFVARGAIASFRGRPRRRADRICFDFALGMGAPVLRLPTDKKMAGCLR